MKNFIFISPNFPTNYWQFCRELKNNGLNVLGIGDQLYDELNQELKDNLAEYYKVNSLENYDEVYRAVAFLIFKHGRIDWIESNNEHWLELDARLRTDFNIASGFQADYMAKIRRKSEMKAFYAKVGVPVARYHLVDDLNGCKHFLMEVGYPVVAKPDNGVGAAGTYKLCREEDLVAFIEDYPKDIPYIMEEFINAQVNSYDAVIDSNGDPIFETGNVTLSNLMEVVNTGDDSLYYIHKELPEDIRAVGRATVKSFGVKSRFVHFEFFRLMSDHAGLGKKGDVMALEVNMRPCGGFTPDMINFANSTNVYKIWADMIAFDKTDLPVGNRQYCAFIGRRDNKTYKFDHNAYLEKYGKYMKMVDRIPDALSGAMGNQMYVANFDTIEEMKQFYADGCMSD